MKACNTAVSALEKKLPCAGGGGQLKYSVFQLGYSPFNDHILEQYFKRHGVSAPFVSDEKFTIADKNTASIGNMVLTIITVEIKVKLIEVEAMPILCISFCLFNLAYQSRIHCINLLV